MLQVQNSFIAESTALQIAEQSFHTISLVGFSFQRLLPYVASSIPHETSVRMACWCLNLDTTNSQHVIKAQGTF